MSSYIRQIQTRLKEAGLYTGDIDGIAGKLTVQAVELAIARGICTANEQKDVTVIHTTDPTVDGNEYLLDEPSTNPVEKSNYTLSELSLKRLQGVNSNLVKVVKRAIEITSVDFRVLEGVRTIEQQREYVRQGKSQTMNSRHLTGHAVDLVAIIDGKISWDWNYYYAIAEAMQQSAKELNVKIRWGGCWEVINDKTNSAKSWVDNYVATSGKQGKKAFIDGPHFELPVFN